MHSLKMLGALAAVLALSAIGAANAPAATFTASSTGSLTGWDPAMHVLTTSGGKIECYFASTSGTIAKTADAQQHVTVNYSQCKAFGFATVDISAATYQLTASGQFHIKNTLSITPTLFGGSICTVTLGPQTVGTVDFSNSGFSSVLATFTLTGIKYTSTGGSCGSSGGNGTYTGSSEFSHASPGQTLRFDH